MSFFSADLYASFVMMVTCSTQIKKFLCFILLASPFFFYFSFCLLLSAPSSFPFLLLRVLSPFFFFLCWITFFSLSQPSSTLSSLHFTVAVNEVRDKNLGWNWFSHFSGSGWRRGSRPVGFEAAKTFAAGWVRSGEDVRGWSGSERRRFWILDRRKGGCDQQCCGWKQELQTGK